MKKSIAIVLLLVMLFTCLIGCGEKFTCESCEEEKRGKKHKVEAFGMEKYFCDECYEEFNKNMQELGEVYNDYVDAYN